VTIVDSMRFANQHHAELQRERVQVIRHTLGADPFDQLAPALDGVELLFHLAAEKHNQSLATPEQLLASNVTGTYALFDAAGKAGVKKLVFSSSLYAYGRVAGAPLVETELSPPWSLYGISKLTGEHLAGHARRQHGIAAVSLRYFFTYGTRQFPGTGYKSVIVSNFERLRRGEAPLVLGDGQQALDYIFVDDVVEATIRAMELPVDGEVINIGSGTPTSINALTKTMLEVAGSDAAPAYGPADWTAGSSRVADASKAHRLLGWRPTVSLRDGLARTYDWVKSR
jgi:UDP-glucose 4-epimerase